MEAAVARALCEQEPATNWQGMVEQARQRFPHLILPDALYEEPLLSREPFDAVIRDRFYVLLGYLNNYMAGRDDVGNEGPGSKRFSKRISKGIELCFHPNPRPISKISRTG